MNPSASDTHASLRLDVWHVVLIYVVFAGLWFGLFDATASWLITDPARRALAGRLEGLAFVGVTAALLGALMLRLVRRHLRAFASERAALQSHDRTLRLLEALVDNSPDAIFAKDREGRYLLFNRAAARVAGISVAQVLGRDDSAVFPAEQAAMLRAHDERVMAQDRPETFEEELGAAGGRTTFLSTKGALHDAGGRVVGLFGISHDITERLAAQQRLRDSERHFRLLFEANPHPMWVFDRETLRFMAVNDAALARYGYTRDEFLALTIADIRPPEERPRLALKLAQVADDPSHVPRQAGTWLHRCKDGRLIEVEVSANDVLFDGQRARLVLAHDVTQQRELERQRQAAHELLGVSETRYRLAASHGQVWDWDMSAGRVTYPAPFWQQLGYEPPPAHEVVARFEALLHPDDLPRWRQAVRAHLVRRAPYDFEFRARHTSGEWRWFHTRGQAVWGADGRATYMAGTTFDTTDRKRAEHALREADAYQRSLFEQLADGVLLIDGAHRVLDANPQMLALLGYRRDELLQLPVHGLVADAERHRVGDVVARVMAGQPHLAEWEFLRKDGSHFFAEASARRLDDQRFVAVVRDITARRTSEQALLTYQLELSELAHRLLAQEKTTTQRVAQALHDHLGQTLAVARLNLDACMSTHGAAMPDALKEQGSRIAMLLDQAVREVRQVLVDLRPPLLEEQGLTAALDNEIGSRAIAWGGADVLLEVADGALGRRWPADVEYGAFMVAREAIANAQQHAGAALIRVLLGGDDDSLNLEVIDDGVGIPAPLVHGRPGHLGIVGMRERAIAIGARFTVNKMAAGGTCVTLRWETGRA